MCIGVVHVHIPCQVEERIQCMDSGQVRYTHKEDTIWQLPVAIEAATNKSRVYPDISMTS